MRVCRTSKFVAALMIACIEAQAAAAASANPLFNGGDPWVVFENGTYFYTASYCEVATICLKMSTTLTGLASAPWIGLWNAPATGPNSKEVWAPEIHKIGDGWYIYYAADDGDNNHHRLFVLQSASNDPKGPWVAGATGGPNGQLVESENRWAIDPDVFTAHDGKLYAVWSCTNYSDGRFPQAICLAEMKDALHVAGATAQISTPVETWETRTAAIQEGPVGFARDGRTYITYSASASWTTNDYAVGLLTNADGRLLNPGSWWKTGPIFDHHDKAYGTGSVVFVTSSDGKETWNLYHGIDSLACNPSYNCRDIRMQKMNWAADGSPVLGYPLDPGVPFGVPSGEPGSVTPDNDASWGSAFGDAASGNADAGKAAGDWQITDGVIAGRSLGADWQRIFSRTNPNLADYTLAVDVQLIETGTTSQFPKYGVYAAYSDTNNYVSVWLDARNVVAATYGLINGSERDWANCPLPAGFDPAAFHTLEVRKAGAVFSVQLDGVHLGGACNDRRFDIQNGQAGLVTEDSRAVYRNVRLIPAGPVFTTTSVVNSATYIHRAIAPGEIVSIFGRDIGPVSPQNATFAGDPPRLATSMNTLQVFFDGVAAPLFYASSDLVNVQVPFEVAGKNQTMMLVSYNGRASPWIPVEVAAADPGVYAAINYDDGQRNAESTPADRGSVITIYGTGQGVVVPAVATGEGASPLHFSEVKDISVRVAGLPARILFAGLAPPYAGLALINVEIPADAPRGPQTAEITIAGISTEFRVWVK